MIGSSSAAKTLTPDQVTALHAWVLVLQRAHPRDRRMIAIGALGDLCNGRWVSCTTCCTDETISNPRMHFYEALAHLREHSQHELTVAESAVTVKP